MNNLFIIVGAAGVGKSTVTEYIREKYTICNCIKKHTTRSLRKEEIARNFDKKLDLIFHKTVDTDINEDNSIIYMRGGKHYWIKYDEVKSQISSYKNSFILFGDFNNAKKLKKKFLYDVKCVIIYVHCDDRVIIDRMKKDNYTDEEIKFRIKRTEPLWHEYLAENFNVVQHCLINSYDINDLYTQIDYLLQYYN